MERGDGGQSIPVKLRKTDGKVLGNQTWQESQWMGLGKYMNRECITVYVPATIKTFADIAQHFWLHHSHWKLPLSSPPLFFHDNELFQWHQCIWNSQFVFLVPILFKLLPLLMHVAIFLMAFQLAETQGSIHRWGGVYFQEVCKTTRCKQGTI